MITGHRMGSPTGPILLEAFFDHLCPDSKVRSKEVQYPLFPAVNNSILTRRINNNNNKSNEDYFSSYSFISNIFFIILFLYYDCLCYSSMKAAWPTIQQVISNYGSQMNFIVHMFPLPYHRNAFYATQAGLVIASAKGEASWFKYLNMVFANQDREYQDYSIPLFSPLFLSTLLFSILFYYVHRFRISYSTYLAFGSFSYTIDNIIS